MFKSNKEVIPSESDLPVSKRGCTDKLFLLLIIFTWVAMNIIGLAAAGYIKVAEIKQGNPQLLLHGVDYEGNICGVDDPVKDLPKRIMPNFYGTNPTNNGIYVPTLLAVCTPNCPDKNEAIVDPYGNYDGWEAPYDSSNFLNNCIYLSEDQDNTSATTIMSDFAHTAGVIALLGFLFSVIFSLLFIFITRIPMVLRSVVWFCVFLIFALLACGGYLLLEKARKEAHHEGHTEVVLLKAVGGFLAGAAVLWLCIICFMRKRIALAINLIREAAISLTSMPLLCFLPILQTIVFAGFTALWMYYCFYLVSSGDVTTYTDSLTGLSYKTISYDLYTQRAIIFMLFAWLWSVGFLEAMGQISSAHAVLTWYFAEVRSDITSRQVVGSILTSLRYHTGTAAIGSFLIALLRGARMILGYIQYKLKKRGGRIAQFFLCCLSCCLLVFEKCLKFLNKHLYIQCALHGTSFFPSAINAFTLLFKNLGRLAAVSLVGDFVVLIGKISVTLTCSGAAYLYMTTYMADELNGFVLPTIFVAFLSFLTSTMFLGVLSGTTDALLQACIEDEKRQLGKSIEHDKGLRDLVIVESKQWKLDDDEDEEPDETVYLTNMPHDHEDDEAKDIENLDMDIQIIPLSTVSKPNKPPKPSPLFKETSVYNPQQQSLNNNRYHTTDTNNNNNHSPAAKPQKPRKPSLFTPN